MKFKNIKVQISLLLAVIMLFSMSTVAFAAENTDNESHFGDILYSDNGITVFYGNPNENEELAEEVEAQSARSLQYDNIWVDANTTATRYAYIDATASNPLTYYTVRQEATSPVTRSRIIITRPNNDDTCFFEDWDGLSTYEKADQIISTSVLCKEPGNMKKYAWTSGTLTLKWMVTTGNSGARMNLWAW